MSSCGGDLQQGACMGSGWEGNKTEFASLDLFLMDFSLCSFTG